MTPARHSLLPALLALAACVGSLPAPSGERMGLRILDASHVEFRGERQSWDAFAAFVHEREIRGEEGVWVALDARGIPVEIVERFLRLAQDAGVRAVDFER